MHRRKHRRERRGRPRLAQAKRRTATTTIAREPAPDHGSPELLLRRAEATGSMLLPDDLLGVLYGRGVIASNEYSTGREFSDLVRLVRLGLGLAGSPAGTWRNILSATPGSPAGLTLEATYPGAERARRALARFHQDLGVVRWSAVSDAADNAWPSDADLVRFLFSLHAALKYLEPQLPLSSRRNH